MRYIIVLATLLAVACEQHITVTNGGMLSLDVRATADGTAQLDSGTVRIIGPTSRTVVLAAGATDTIGDLEPGSYRVVIEGLEANEVVSYGETRDVDVVAGANTSVSVSLSSFVPTLDTLPTTADGASLGLSFAGVQGASSYLIEIGTTSAFSTVTVIPVGETEVVVNLSGFGQRFVRVVAVSEFGALGRPSAARSTIVPLTFIDIDASSGGVFHFSCGVATDSTAYCWGGNSSGQLGNGGFRDRSEPTQVSDSLKFSMVRAGARHACGVTTSGDAYCWGSNLKGQLGDGTKVAALSAPTAVLGGLRFASIDAGQDHTCGLVSNIGVYCWGDNSFGQLGTGDTLASNVPRAVGGGPVPLFDHVTVGATHSCAVSTLNRGYCWGNGANGRLGTGGPNDDSLVPVQVQSIFLTSIHPGGDHTCGWLTNGDIWCWGRGQQGQLGNGFNVTVGSPDPVIAPFAFTSNVSGHEHTCGLAGNGTAFCWGLNSSGQLGTGNSTSFNLPEQVSSSLEFTRVSAGEVHTCAIALNGRGYCWGANTRGQLGTGTTDPSLVPVAVVTP